jgi:beta-galactosidase
MDNAFIDKAHLIAHEEYPGDQCFPAGWQRYRYDIFLQARLHRLGKYSDPLKPYIVSEYGDWEYYAQNAGFNQDSWSDLLQSERSSRQLLADGEVRLLQQTTNIQEAHNDNFNTAAFADGYWAMFDYNRGYADDLEASGLMSIDRIPKFSYYFFQSQRPAIEHSQKYTSGPMVHIASWWTKDSPLNVRAFSNCDEVELFLNGRSLGVRKPDNNRISGNLAHPPFTFPVERFERGTLLAKGYIDGKEVASHVVRTPGEAVRLVLEIDESGRPPKSDCNDVVFVYAKIVDEHGTVIRDKSSQVFFDIKGDAKVVNPEAVYTEAGIGTALLKIGKQARYITLTANVDGLTGEIKFRPR